jgi:precorrin-6B methylase 2
MKIVEVNKDTLTDSNDDNLQICRHWALTQLRKIKNNFDVIYILGSWYGNLSLMLSDFPSIKYEKIINIDIDEHSIDTSNKLVNKNNITNIENVVQDANTVDYNELGPDGLVINFSTTNIEGTDWFNNIDQGTLVLLKARNNDPGAINKFNNITDLIEKYPLKRVLFQGTKELTDPETAYECYVVIGLK